VVDAEEEIATVVYNRDRAIHAFMDHGGPWPHSFFFFTFHICLQDILVFGPINFFGPPSMILSPNNNKNIALWPIFSTFKTGRKKKFTL